MTEMDDAVFAEGQNAFDAGFDEASCPYPEGYPSQTLWIAGWDEAYRWAHRKRPEDWKGSDD